MGKTVVNLSTFHFMAAGVLTHIFNYIPSLSMAMYITVPLLNHNTHQEEMNQTQLSKILRGCTDEL